MRPRLGPGYRVLEVGCGTGNVLRVLQRAADGGSVFGTDLALEGLRYARRRLEPANLVVSDATRPAFSVKFDVIGAFDVIEHIEDDVAALRRLRDLLKTGGILLLTVPANPRLWSYFDVAAHHQRRYGQDDLHDKLVAAGYGVELLTPFMTVLQPLMWAGRRWAAARGRARAIEPGALIANDLRARPVIGSALQVLLMPEIAVIRRGGRLPAGASLLAIATAS